MAYNQREMVIEICSCIGGVLLCIICVLCSLCVCVSSSGTQDVTTALY